MCNLQGSLMGSASRPSVEYIPLSGGARVFTQGGHENFFWGATYVFDGGTELAKWATD